MSGELWIWRKNGVDQAAYDTAQNAVAAVEASFQGCETEWEEVQYGAVRGTKLWKGCGGRWRDTGNWIYRYSLASGPQLHETPEATPRRKRKLPAWRA